MYINLSKEKIIQMLEGAEDVYVEVEEFSKGNDRNSYFDRNENLYEQMMDDIDNLVFLQDKVSIVREKYSYNGSSTLSDIFFKISSTNIDEIDGYEDLSKQIDDTSDDDTYVSLDDMTLQEIEVKYPKFYTSVIEVLDNLTDDDIDIYDDGSTLFDCSYIDETINNDTFEALAYWTIYFSPSYDDKDIAVEVGLVPFEYDGTFYLALGGCGMDLSPKLDAYIALAYGRLPKDSNFYSDKDYFKHVVGEHAYNKIIEKCKLEKYQYNLSFSFGNTKEE